MRLVLLAALVVAAAGVAAAPPAPLHNECRGIQQCISVPGPWVVVPGHGTAQFLLTCPKGVVAGLDSVVTSREVHVSFVARLGAPVQPGQTTSRSALFEAVTTSSRTSAFQPFLGCVPQQGGGGRSTVSARVTPAGPSLEYRSRVVHMLPGDVKVARVSCLRYETLVGGWHAIAFRTKQPPNLAGAAHVHATHVLGRRTVVGTATSTDSLSPDANTIVQTGAVCAP
ncbi:MAG TPA: hypothetical protein VI408_12280 [Gaiellaceae bacterium]